ncbi:MAG: flavin reductase family protein [Chloroflexi bacterium]|nr:flavin reductase family protein [Chloroflexota bacterium]
MTPSSDEFRRAWGKFPTGVSVITTHTEGGDPYCTTANAISSVSLDPLLIHLSLGKDGATCANIVRERRFGINILRSDQEELARFFATASSDERQKLPSAHEVTEHGTSLLTDALVVMDCKVVQEVEAGDHIVFIAEVDGLEVREGEPLVFYEGKFSKVE